jgi:hypothetical protein
MGVDSVSNTKARLIFNHRLQLAEAAFVELVLWSVPKPVSGSTHGFKYRLAYVVAGVCALRYDNELGKGDHKHSGSGEVAYLFTGPETLLADFWKDVARWDDENRDS